MKDNTRWWCITIVLVLIILAFTAISGCREIEETRRTMAKEGYIEVPNVGFSGYHWEKAPGK